jgi:hypothetical protein
MNKVIKIQKTYRNADVTGFVVLGTEKSNNAEAWAQTEAEKWCEKEGGGQNYGYEYEWSILREDVPEEMELIEREIAKYYGVLKQKISKLDFECKQLHEALEKIRLYNRNLKK